MQMAPVKNPLGLFTCRPNIASGILYPSILRRYDHFRPVEGDVPARVYLSDVYNNVNGRASGSSTLLALRGQLKYRTTVARPSLDRAYILALLDSPS